MIIERDKLQGKILQRIKSKREAINRRYSEIARLLKILDNPNLCIEHKEAYEVRTEHQQECVIRLISERNRLVDSANILLRGVA